MTQLLDPGGSRASPPFRRFMELTVGGLEKPGEAWGGLGGPGAWGHWRAPPALLPHVPARLLTSSPAPPPAALCQIRGFLASRSVAESVCAAVALMEPSQVRETPGGALGAWGACCGGSSCVSRPPGSSPAQPPCSPHPRLHHTLPRPAPRQLPCFGHGKPLDALRQRFRLELSPAQAAAYMRGLILGAYDKWTTGGYDYIQYLQVGAGWVVGADRSCLVII